LLIELLEDLRGDYYSKLLFNKLVKAIKDKGVEIPEKGKFELALAGFRVLGIGFVSRGIPKELNIPSQVLLKAAAVVSPRYYESLTKVYGPLSSKDLALAYIQGRHFMLGEAIISRRVLGLMILTLPQGCYMMPIWPRQ